MDSHLWESVCGVCVPLVVDGVTFSRCLLHLCGVCAWTGLPGTPSPSLGEEGRHHSLWRLPGGFETLSYAQIGVNPPPWGGWCHLLHTNCSQDLLSLQLPRVCSTFAACAQAVPANELFVFLGLCQHYFFL